MEGWGSVGGPVDPGGFLGMLQLERGRLLMCLPQITAVKELALARHFLSLGQDTSRPRPGLVQTKEESKILKLSLLGIYWRHLKA